MKQHVVMTTWFRTYDLRKRPLEVSVENNFVVARLGVEPREVDQRPALRPHDLKAQLPLQDFVS